LSLAPKAEAAQIEGPPAPKPHVVANNNVTHIERRCKQVEPDQGAETEPLIITPTAWVCKSESLIPPRGFIYGGHYVRSYLSQTVAAYGVGKSSLTIAEAIVIATGRPLLCIEPKETCPVWVFNGEDPLEELERKIWAVIKHFGLDPRMLAGRLFYDSGRLLKMKIARRLRGDAVVDVATKDAITRAIKENGIGVMIVDPFVTTHRVKENDNDEMELVAEAWADVANDTNASIEIVHHARKTNGAEITMEDARGASSVCAKARSGRLLNRMQPSEGSAAGVNSLEFFSAGYGKTSLRPPNAGVEWYRFRSVLLANGDNVGVVTPTEPARKHRRG
jgi:RecA-family ATPase